MTIVTNAGGPGVLATDALIASGSELLPVSAATAQKLDAVLPSHWSHANPIDLIDDARPDRYEKALEILTDGPECDGLLVIMTPQAMSDPAATAEKLVRFAQMKNKPLLTSWIGGASCQEGNTILNAAGIPTFAFPDGAARAFDYMWRYSYNLRALYETPATTAEERGSAKSAETLIETVRHSGRSLLTEFESKQILAAYGIPCVETLLAPAETGAVEAAERLGYPVVLKLHSFTITHKTDVGGVKLSLANAAAVRTAFREIQSSIAALKRADEFLGVTVQRMFSQEGYELLLGSTVDKQFGPVLMFGLGGQLVEVFQDRAIGLPPLNTTLARRLMERTKIYSALKGVRGRKPVNLIGLEQLLVRFSELVTEQPWIREMDINPLIASPEGLLVLDARVLLYPPETDSSQIIKPAIRPYPSKYIVDTTLSDGAALRVRPIRPEDEPLIVSFHGHLSEHSVYYRYFTPLDLQSRTRHERLTRICFIDYDREMALVAEHQPSGGAPEIIGVGRLIKIPGSSKAELAVVVSDANQQRGIGSSLTKHLIEFAKDEGLNTITASVLFENRSMQALLENFGFVFDDSTLGDDTLKANLEL